MRYPPPALPKVVRSVHTLGSLAPSGEDLVRESKGVEERKEIRESKG